MKRAGPDGSARWERLQVLSAAAVLGGFLHHYYVVFLRQQEGAGQLAGLYERIVDGVADAPYQYRVLVPRLAVWAHDQTGLAYRLVAVVIDGAALFAGGVAVLGALRALGLHRFVVGAALYIAFLGYGTTTFGKPETFTAFFAASLLTLAFVRSSNRGANLLLVMGSAVLAGTRMDVLAAFAIAYGVRWWWRRDRRDLYRAAFTFGVAVTATIGFIALYPDAAYPPGISLVQLSHSLRPNNLLIPVLFLVPALAPLWPSRGRLRSAIGVDVAALLVAIAAFSLATVIVSRVDEVRLWFPLAGAIACIGAAAWAQYGEAAARSSVPRS